MHTGFQQQPARPTVTPGAAAAHLEGWAIGLGFQEVGIADTDLSAAEAGLLDWLAAGCHGEMDYMARHGLKRARPAELAPGTIRIISVRMNYWPAGVRDAEALLADPERGYV